MPEKDPRTILTLSAQREVPLGTTRSPDDPHRDCRNRPLPVDRSRNGGFWSKVHKTDCCWLWTRSRTGALGYGAFWQGGKIVRAHRVAYEELVGPIADGLDLMHICDVPLCVRPDHLRAGTHAENQQDMAAKGRNAPHAGESNGHARFTWAAIHEIRRRRAEPRGLLASQFATSPKYIYKIVRGLVWSEAACPIHSEVAA